MFPNYKKREEDLEGFLITNFLMYNPHIKKEDIIHWELVDEGFEIFVSYRNHDGREMTMLYDTFTNTTKAANPINYMDNSTIKRVVKYRLNRIMKHQFMDQKTLCSVTEIPESTMSRYCRGESVPDAVHLARIAYALKVDVNAFFTKYF